MKTFLKEHGEEREIKELTAKELDLHFGNFTSFVKKQNKTKTMNRNKTIKNSWVFIKPRAVPYTPIPLGGDLSTPMAIVALLQNLPNRRGNADVGRNFGPKIPKYAFSTLL